MGTHSRPTCTPRRLLLLLIGVIAAVCALGQPARAQAPGRNGLIAVHTFRGEHEQMWVIRPDGTGVTRLPATGEGVFAPDGRRLALAEQNTISVTDLSGQGPRVVLRSKTITPDDIAWAAAGDQLYFSDYRTNSSPLYSLPAAGGQPRLIISDGEAPDVSITGRIAYEAPAPASDKENDSYVATAAADGTDRHLIGPGSSPSWSPDGTKIAFDRDYELWIANADGSGATKVWTSESEDLRHLTWSPDGTQIAVIVEDSDSSVESLAVVDLATNKLRKVATDRRFQAGDDHLLVDVEWQPLQGDDQIVLPTAPKLGPCQMLGSDTILKNRRGRVFTENGEFYGCLYSAHRIFRLVGDFDQGGFIERFQLAGPFVGFDFRVIDVDSCCWGYVRVVDLRNGHKREHSATVDRPGIDPAIEYADIPAIRTSVRGGLAWIARAYGFTDEVERGAPCRRSGHVCNYPYEVHVLDSRGHRTLDLGPGVDPKSLTLHGQMVGWKHDGRRLHARLR